MALAESIVSFAVDKIRDQAIQEVIFLCGVRGQVESIKSELRAMQRFLSDADAKRRDGNEDANKWVVEVMDAAYDAEDAIEMFLLRVERKRRRGFAQKCVFVFFFNDLCVLHKIGSKIEQINNLVSDISRRKSTYNSTEISEGEGSSISRHRKLLEYRRNAAVAKDDEVVGFTNDAGVLVKRLTTGDERCRVISIVALGGAGKTTLVKKVYNSSDVRNHFGGCVAWVCVSQNYSVEELLRDIAEQVMKMSKQDSAKLNVKALQETLSQFLKERRYLIVLDDIWEKDAWDQLREAFPNERNGSRIMFSTRDKTVALHADPDPANPPYELPQLNKEESWLLFLKKVFPSTTSCTQDLEDLGKQIVAKCNGLPLAIEVIGSLLATKEKTRRYWSYILSSLDRQLSQRSLHCSDILALSYYDLPHHLKPCFLYLGIFPEDHQIRVKKLIRLWVAEGFIQQEGPENQEDVAKDYLDELISRSMIQVAGRKLDGSVRTCRVHDLLRDLAVSEARKDHFLEIDRNINDPTSTTATTTVRRLAIHDETKRYDSLNQTTINLRSLLCFTEVLPKLPNGGTKFLRVLDLENAPIHGDRLFDALGALIHIKYLSLYGPGITSLPPSIEKLYNLETLRLSRVMRVSSIQGLYTLILRNAISHNSVSDWHVGFPEAVWNMDRLKHLVVYRCKFEGRPQLHHLKDLQTLSITAGSWIEEGGLSGLTGLRKLGLHGDLSSHRDALCDSIKELVNLRALILETLTRNLPPLMSFTHHLDLYKIRLKGRLQKLLQPHEFPPNLSKLHLENSRLEGDPMATLEKLQNLQILKLDWAYVGQKMISSAQGFPRLKYLELVFFNELEEWIVEKGAMPELTNLCIGGCRKLTMLPQGLHDVTTLQKFVTYKMSGEFYDRLRQDRGEDWYKIEHIPTIQISRDN